MKSIILSLFSLFFFTITANAVNLNPQPEPIHSVIRAGARTRVIKLQPKSIDYIQITWRDGRNKNALGQLYIGDSLQDANTVFSKYGSPEEIPDYPLSQIPPLWDAFTRAPYKYLQVGVEEEDAYIYSIVINYSE